MVVKVNGGIISDQTLTGKLRFFKMDGRFDWTISDGTVNLPVSFTGGSAGTTTYFVVGENRPIPNSAAEHALRVITEKCDVVQIGVIGVPGDDTSIHFACSASAFGWGSSTPGYSDGLADADEDPAAAAAEMQAAVRLLGSVVGYRSVGPAADPEATPVTFTSNMTTVTITEVDFQLF